MIWKLILWLRLALSARRLNAHQAVEILALRQQLGMYTRREKKPKFTQRDRLFWIILYRLWPGWLNIILNERHLKTILKDYFDYYHDDRTHYNLGKETPTGRRIQRKPTDDSKVVAVPKLGGLHHRYEWRVAA